MVAYSFKIFRDHQKVNGTFAVRSGNAEFFDNIVFYFIKTAVDVRVRCDYFLCGFYVLFNKGVNASVDHFYNGVCHFVDMEGIVA